MDEDGSSPSLVRGVPTGRVVRRSLWGNSSILGVRKATLPSPGFSHVSVEPICAHLAALADDEPAAGTLGAVAAAVAIARTYEVARRARPTESGSCTGRPRVTIARVAGALGGHVTAVDADVMYGPPPDGRQVEVLNGVAAVALAAVQ